MVATSKPPHDKPPIDWERIEQQYRAGVMTLREIAAEHRITHGAINQRAKRHHWERDLAAKIKAKADLLLSKSAVSSAVSKSKADTERIVVDLNAAAVAGVVIRHRTDLTALRDTAMSMLAELIQIGEHGEAIDEIAKLVAAGDAGGDPDPLRLEQMREALRRVCSLPGRVSSIKALAETITKLMDAERTAWKLDKPLEGADGAGGKTLSDAERASRLATILERARRRAAEMSDPRAADPSHHAVH